MKCERSFAARRQNWAWLIFLCAAGFFVVSRGSSHTLAAMAYPFLGTVGMPGYLLLLGGKSRDAFPGSRQTACAGLGLIALGYLQKVLVYWAQVLLDQDPVFYPFSTSGASWLLLVGGAYLLFAALWQERGWSGGPVLACAVLVGLAGGLIRPFDSFLCLAQLCAFLPFFVVGRLLSGERLQRLSRPGLLRVPAAAVLCAGAAGCLLLWDKLKAVWSIVDGDCWYGKITGLSSAEKLILGPVLRLSWYGVALALLWALFVLVPDRKLPLATGQGSRALTGYFWFMPLAYLTLAPLSSGLTVGHLLLSGALSLALLLAAPSRLAAGPVEWMLNAPWRALTDQARPERLDGGSFYSRHRWGIQMTALFTVAFCVVLVAYVYPFDSNGKSMIWTTDGMEQQYPMMFYFKEYILEVIENLLTTGKLSFPQWDFSLGLGMSPLDAIRREPFMLLSLLGNEETMEYVAGCSNLLRLYVCGLVFIWYCYTLGRREKLPVLMGTLVYVFSGFAIFVSPRQPYFVTVLMTYLVLMLIGAERFIQRRRYGVFVLAVALQLFSGYYTAYINGVILAVYLIIRLGCLYEWKLTKMAAQIGRLIGLYLWGAGIAMVTLLPGILSLLGSARSQGSQELNLFYSNSYYRRLLTGLNLEFGGSGYWAFVSLAAIGWLACVVLFLRHRKEQRPLRFGLAACFLALCLPVAGLVSNGFAYVSNRWCFAVPLVVGLILVEAAPDLLELRRRDKGVLLAVVLIYVAVVVTRPEVVGSVKLIGLVVLCMTAMVLLMMDQFLRSRRMRMGVLSVITVLSVMINLAASFLPELGNYVDLFQDSGTAYDAMSGAVDEALEVLERSGDDSFYRIAVSDDLGNQSMGLGYYGVSTYFSVNPQGVSDYFASLGFYTQYQSFRIYGMDERTAPTTLASVKYFVSEDGARVPYGFTALETLADGEAVLYENQYTLPIGYTYTSYITQEEYDQLTPLERQQVMLEAAVLTESTDALTQATPSYREEKIPCEVTSTEDLTLDETEKTITVEEEKGKFRLKFESQPGCETYLVITGLRFSDESSNDEVRVVCSIDGQNLKGAVRGRNQSYYFERDAVVFNLGYSEESITNCMVYFTEEAELCYDEIYVVSIPMDGYADQIEQLSEVTLEQVEETDTGITGAIELEDTRLLTLTIPYSEGWTAYVNGQEAEVLQVNEMYCGLLLEPGSYEIELRYQHPGLKAGAAISAVSIAAIVPAAVIGRRRRRKAIKSRTPV